MTVGMLAQGVSPARIVPSAAAVVRELATVEASDLAVVGGCARVTVRFTGDDDDHAQRVAAHAVAGLRRSAQVVTWFVTRRDGGRWNPVSALPANPAPFTPA